MRHILVIEDEKEILRLIVYNFEKKGYHVTSVSEGAAGLQIAEREKPDLVILDIMLPKMSGLEVCRALRARSNMPIIVLSAQAEEIDRIVALEIGADDYVTKPFSIRELVARVEALLRRTWQRQDPLHTVTLGRVTVDLDRYLVTEDQKPLAISTREFQLLRILLEANGKALSRDQLLEKIWGFDRSYEIDTRTIDQHIARLRRKLGRESKRLITVKNIGYRLERTVSLS